MKSGRVSKALSNIKPIPKKTPTLTAISAPLPSESCDETAVRATGFRVGKSFNVDPQIVCDRLVCLTLVNGNTN
jgi:hypothetical protein